MGRSNDKSKRGHHNTIFVETPQSFNVQNDPIQINQPSFYGTQLASEDQTNNDVGGIDIENPPQLPYPSMYFDVRQEEDGGILIEPDHIPSMASEGAHQDQQRNVPISQGDELNYVIPSYQIRQPTIDVEFPDSAESSHSLQIPFHPHEEQQLTNLIWMGDNIREQPNQEQANPLSFRPTIWVDDDTSNSYNTNGNNADTGNQFEGINIDPESLVVNYQLPEEESNNGDIEISNDFDPGIYSINDQTVFQKRDDGSNDEQEVLYLPVYGGPDTEYLNRHKFSTLSKRSMDSHPNTESNVEAKEFKETYEYPVMVSLDGKEVPSIHYTLHDEEEPSGLREDVDVYEPTLMEDKDTSGLYGEKDSEDDGESNYPSYSLVDVSKEDNEKDNENSLGSFTFNRKERLDVKKPGPFFPNSENNFFFEKLLASDNTKEKEKRDEEYEIDDSGKTKDQGPSAAIIGDPFGPRRSNYSEDGKGQMEYEMPLQVLNPDPKKRFLMVHEVADSKPEEELQKQQLQAKKFLHLMMKKRFDKWQQGMDLVDVLADELGVPRHALHDERIDDHHVQFRVDPNPQNIDAEKMAKSLDNDIILKKRISDQIGVEVAQAAAGDRNDYDVSKFPATAINNILYIVLVATSTLAILNLSAAILVLTRHCVRRRRQNDALNKVHKQDVLESERGKVQEEYKQLCRDWSKKSTTNPVQPGDPTTKTSVVSDGSKSSPTSAAIKKVQGQDSKTEGSNRSSTSSWNEEPTSTNMDISTGHMVLAYMEDHLKNKQRLEQ